MVLTADPTTAQPAPAEQAVARSSRFNIPGDVVARTVSELGDTERAALLWLAQHCQEKNLSIRDIAPQLKKRGGEEYSYDSIYQAFTGRREPGQLAPLAEAINRYRRLVEESSVRLASNFVEWSATRRFDRLANRCRASGSLSLVYGESQIGKTVTAQHYKEVTDRDHPGETHYVRMPTRGSAYTLLHEIALVRNIPGNQSYGALRRTVIDSFDDRMLLCIDQAHDGGTDALMLAMEIFDRRRCGCLLIGTQTLRSQLEFGKDAKKFRQIVLRSLPPMRWPDQPRPADLALFAAAYDLGPAAASPIAVEVADPETGKRVRVTKSPEALQSSVISEWGLGRWCKILAEAREIARERRKAITWGSVLVAWHAFESLAGGALAAGEEVAQ